MSKMSVSVALLLKVVISASIIIFSLQINVLSSIENAFAVFLGTLLIVVGDRIYSSQRDNKRWLFVFNLFAFIVCVLVKYYLFTNVYVNVITFVCGIALVSFIFVFL